jgi:hypothetical protein
MEEFCQLFNVHGVNDVKQTEIQTAEQQEAEPSSAENEVATDKLEIYKSPIIYQIPAEMIQEGSNILHSKIHELINSIWNREELPQQWKKSITVPLYKKW